MLKAPVEIHSCLRMLLDAHDALVVTFVERRQRYQSYVVEIDRERNRIALDEVIPNEGERFLQNGEAFRVEASHEGIRIAWDCREEVQFGELEGHRCYWLPIPTDVLYHQRRNAFRATVSQSEVINVELQGQKLKAALSGRMLDISATGCQVRFSGDVSDRLQPGQVYERFSMNLPSGSIRMEVELRHVRYDDKLNLSFAGLRFHRLSGLEQRQVERFVYHLQREARRFEKEELF